MSPRRQSQQQRPGGSSGGSGPPAGSGGSSSSAANGAKPGSGSSTSTGGVGKPGMNYFAALAGHDAEALKEEISAKEDERRAAAAGSAGGGRQSGGGEGGGMKQPLVWIDLEMTGLDVERDCILQIAVICTDGALEQEAVGPEIAIHQPEEVLQSMNEWCVEQHGKSGLTQACRDSTVSLAEAEQQVLEFVQQHVPEPGIAQIAGNSVHVDLSFLRKWMPRLVEHLHYRIVDVSTVGELCRRWFPREHMRAPKKKNLHTALADIQESIQQLRFYRRSIFKKWSGANLP